MDTEEALLDSCIFHDRVTVSQELMDNAGFVTLGIFLFCFLFSEIKWLNIRSLFSFLRPDTVWARKEHLVSRADISCFSKSTRSPYQLSKSHLSVD